MASPSQNISSRNLRKKSQKHVETLANGGAALCLLFWVAALISQYFLRGPTDLNGCSIRLMISSLLVLLGAAQAFFWDLFEAAVTELQGAKNFLKTLLTQIGFLQLAFILVYLSPMLSGRSLVGSESYIAIAESIFNISLLLQLVPICILFLGLNTHDQLYMTFYILSQVFVFCGGIFPSLSYILLVNLGPTLMYHLVLVSLVIGCSFGFFLCIVSTYSDILGEIGPNTRAREQEILIQI